MLALSREITSSIDTSNILSERRTQRVRKDDDFIYVTTIQPLNKEPPALLYAFIASLYAEKLDYRHYKDNLLLLLKH